MKKVKTKSLGRMKYPRFEIESFNGYKIDGEIVLKLSDFSNKSICLEMGIHQVSRLTEIAHELIEKYQEHIDFEQAQCKRLKERSTYRGK